MQELRKSSEAFDFRKCMKRFSMCRMTNEDDVKVNFYNVILQPLLRVLNPECQFEYKSEHVLRAGGRTDATFKNISFEYKRPNYFRTQKGINEALFGRDDKDHGLYHYLINDSQLAPDDDLQIIANKISKGVGVGFDGKKFVFARFSMSPKEVVDFSKSRIQIDTPLKMSFTTEILDIEQGVRRLALLVRQQEKIQLTKQNVLGLINPKSEFVRDSIRVIYRNLAWNLTELNGSNRVRTMYGEWDRVFGIMYGDDVEATDFTEVSSAVRDLYGIPSTEQISSKEYLFALQTFFNIFLKLLIHTFLSQLVDPTFSSKIELQKSDVNKLFDGTLRKHETIVANFFEAHFLEWFTFTESGFEVPIVNKILCEVDRFDLTSFMLKPELVQDILQEVYMELIPVEMRHLMGEYFSPDWIVEHALDMAGYFGDLSKSLMDPTAGSGPFITQALKRIVLAKQGKLSREEVEQVVHKIVGFDINPISVVAAKANYILILISAFFASGETEFGDPINIPVFIADSILAPVVYTEENGASLKVTTSAGELELPKFSDFASGNSFLVKLSHAVHEKAEPSTFINYVRAKKLIDKKDEPIARRLFDRLCLLHRAGRDSFWPIVLRNSYAPVMIGNKFDFVVGNPPWIAWKSMSKSYRDGTLKIWKSYGIFEKNAYDKKTTHDDFGMAVTYVAIDQYLKDGGTMVFLLPASFLKSTKGGEGFRKFEIVRNGQHVPFKIDAVHDFSGVNLFTIPTSAVKFVKGSLMRYPMTDYIKYRQKEGRKKIDSHFTWQQVEQGLSFERLSARPVDENDIKSAWLTLADMDFANKVLDRSVSRFYKGRKGIEPAGAKGVYILRKPIRVKNGLLRIENDILRQRRRDVVRKGVNIGNVEDTYVYPMLGGRNIAKWKVKSNEFMLVPHTAKYKYGVPVDELAATSPDTYEWLSFYHDELFESRKRNGKFFNPLTNPFYRLDNVGPYTFAPYKVLWKEQSGKMAAVVVGGYLESVPMADASLFSRSKPVVVDSKVLMLGLDDEFEANFVCGVINSQSVAKVIDGYAIGTNRGVDVLKYVAVPKYDPKNRLHNLIARISLKIHMLARRGREISAEEKRLDDLVVKLFNSVVRRRSGM